MASATAVRILPDLSEVGAVRAGERVRIDLSGRGVRKNSASAQGVASAVSVRVKRLLDAAQGVQADGVDFGDNVVSIEVAVTGRAREAASADDFYSRLARAAALDVSFDDPADFPFADYQQAVSMLDVSDTARGADGKLLVETNESRGGNLTDKRGIIDVYGGLTPGSEAWKDQETVDFVNEHGYLAGGFRDVFQRTGDAVKVVGEAGGKLVHDVIDGAGKLVAGAIPWWLWVLLAVAVLVFLFVLVVYVRGLAA